MKKDFVIYMITNTITGKSYIGQSIDFEARKIRHLSSVRLKRDNYYIHSAIRKYGEGNFRWVIVTTCRTVYTGKTQSILNSLESFFIAYYDTYNNGYNLTIGGEGMSGYKLSKETRQKISERNVSEETRQKLSNAARGRKFTEETKRKISESKKGKPLSKAAREKISGKNSFNFGKSPSEETRKKISKANKGKKPWTYGKKHSEESKQKMSKAKLGKKLSDETKQKVSENSYMAKPVIINGKRYVSITQAEKDLNIGRNIIPKKIRTGYPGYHFETFPEE
jgi:group I intron endonuclease